MGASGLGSCPLSPAHPHAESRAMLSNDPTHRDLALPLSPDPHSSSTPPTEAVSCGARAVLLTTLRPGPEPPPSALWPSRVQGEVGQGRPEPSRDEPQERASQWLAQQLMSVHLTVTSPTHPHCTA